MRGLALEADFLVQRFRRFQAAVETTTAIGVGQLADRGSLEGGRDASVDGVVRVQAIAEADAVVEVAQVAFARVVAVTQEVVVDAQAHRVVAQAEAEQPVLGQLGLVFDEQTQAAGFLPLTGDQCTLLATDVVVAITVVAQGFEVAAEGELVLEAEPVGDMGVVGTDAAEQALVAGLAVGGQGQAVFEIPLPDIAADLVGVFALRLAIPHQRQALLGDALVRVERQAFRTRLIAISTHLAEVQSTRVFRAVVQRMHRQRQASRLAPPAHLAGKVVGLTGGVLAIALRLSRTQRQQRADIVLRATGFDALPAKAVAAEADIAGDTRLLARLPGIDRQDATRAVAIEHRRRTAQHLHALHQAKVETIQLGLAVGHGQWHAVHQHANTAHTEAGTRTEAANRRAQALGGVVAALHHHARHAG